MKEEHLALDGVLIAEVGERISASVCGSLRAHLGATVVVLELHTNRATGSSSKWRRRASALAGKLSVSCDTADPRCSFISFFVSFAASANPLTVLGFTKQTPHCCFQRPKTTDKG